MSGEINTASLTLTNEILALISELDEFKGAWRAIGKIEPERLARMRRVATIESAGSSTRIEGARLTDGEVAQLLSRVGTRSLTTRDEQEVAGYAEVMEAVFEHWESITLTENHVRQLHRDLLRYSEKDERHRGEYKRVPNHIEAVGPDGKSLGVIFQTATPFATPERMRELILWTRSRLSKGDLHPLLTIAVFVVVLLEIHPFQDGNGRLSRVLTTLLLLRAGYAYVPHSSLEGIVEQTKDGYYLALRQTQGTIRTKAPDWQPWIRYSLRTLQEQKRRLEQKINQEQLILGDLPRLSAKILDLARERGRVTTGEAARATLASRNTIKDHIRALVGSGRLVRRGAGRGSWYSLG